MEPLQESAPMQQKAADEKFCSSCGSVIKILAEICPKCGVRQQHQNRINKTALILLAFFLGGIGGHKFYLGKIGQGIVYLLFCWTFIPGIIALIELIIYATKSEDELNQKYSNPSSGSVGVMLAVIAGAFGLIVIIGMIAALAIPRFLGATDKVKFSECKPVMRQIYTLEEAYYQETGKYTSDLSKIEFEPPTSSRFSYSVDVTSPTSFVVHAKLLTRIGNVDPGEEAMMNSNAEISATGKLSEYVH